MGLPFFLRHGSSKCIAKDRLKLLLVSDRANCSPEMMEMLKNDIINVISKYMDIDRDNMSIKISHPRGDGNSTCPLLSANIPIREIKNK